MSETGAVRRSLRIGAALAAFLLLATPVPPSRFAPVPQPPVAAIAFEAVPLDRRLPGRERLGRLRFLGGWHLTSEHRSFGGISAMHVADGQVVALSDAGILIRFPLAGSGGTVRGRIEPLPDGPGSPRVKSDRDSESLAVDGRRAWIGFERRNAIWRYRLPDWKSDAHRRPPAMRRWPNNSGAEGLVRLSDGRFLVFSESAPAGDGTFRALLFAGDPAARDVPAVPLRYRPPPGYRLTDAAQLPDGRLLLLNRRFSLWKGFAAKLVLAQLPEAAPDAVIEGKEIARFSPPLATDNMEALSVGSQAGRTIVWIASDDNFNPLQRTLLLKFELE